ncbi:TIR domain-containing protein [Sphingomonas sp. HDW15A]|uniref:TIR domain-containing protein n=1 Tax=Sphingomonas sp. HDW15A TaxID=2714942 RepID=UPI00140B9FCC|nr:TIR domain-containing protein [Sphingomonas sp. HDW15A]QIK96318.1 TIR domain-containing protein [Sphingomonas sp. HDW15A]
MADVFLSYASADREIAERLARAIQQSGLSVWWDRHIKGGAEFSRDIERQLEGARHVLVLWSKEAVNSRWVRDEASVAADTNRIVAATIDGTPAPLGFRQFQTIDLRAWSTRSPRLPADLLDALEVESEPASKGPPANGRQIPRLLVIGGILAAVAGGVLIVRPEPVDQFLSGKPKTETLALAVLPFTTEGGPEIRYLGTGLSSALADSLAPLSGLKITASTSSQSVATQGLAAPDIAKRLGITHLVEGRVQKLGDRFSITARLVAAETSEQLWTRTVEGAASELQGLKSQITRELAGAIRARLGAGEGEIAERGKVDPKAFEAYLRALERVSVRDDRAARLEAIKQFRLAASLEPDFADAHAGYAYLLSLSSPDQVGLSWKDLRAEQSRSVDRALALDPENDLALVARAMALQNFEGNVHDALSINRAVLKRSQNFGPAHYSMASGLWMQGKSREAVNHIEQAIDLDPFDTLLQFYRTKILYSLGDYDAVRISAEQCRQRCAGTGWFWLLAIAAYRDEKTFRSDFPLIAKWILEEGGTAEDVAEARGIANAYVTGGAYRPRPIEDRKAEFIDAALDSRLFDFETGMKTARLALATAQPDSILDILNDGRVTFSSEQRADPQYHALFRDPKLAKIAAARRREGVAAGLPVFPVKPYTGR